MPLSPPAPRHAVHERHVHCTGHHRADGWWDIEGHIVDSKHYAFDNVHRGEVAAGEAVHEMWIRVTIDDDMTIQAVEAVTDHAPYRICPQIVGNFQRLVGLTIGPGFRRQVFERVGGTEGCTHLTELLGPIATTAFQTLTAKRRVERERDPNRAPRFLDTCHAHARTSVVVKEFWPQHYTGND